MQILYENCWDWIGLFCIDICYFRTEVTQVCTYISLFSSSHPNMLRYSGLHIPATSKLTEVATPEPFLLQSVGQKDGCELVGS